MLPASITARCTAETLLKAPRVETQAALAEGGVRMGAYALAIDLGASSGRHILGHIENGKIVLTEIYRFSNSFTRHGSHLCWDVEQLYAEIITGLCKCKALGVQPTTLAIDTWGVDYVLVDQDGNRIGDAVAYRDNRTCGMPEMLDAVMPPEILYVHTGIARQPYNTVYQLMAAFTENPEYRSAVKHLLFMPCYLHYLLTGVMRNEYTIASTSGLINAKTKDWDGAVLAAAGIPPELMGPAPAMPGTVLAPLRAAVAAEVGFSCDVVLPACHDTGSAYMAVPYTGGNAAFLSSGTWSLLGMELEEPVLTRTALTAGFTNEGGFGGNIRFLRNIMGLWILQSLRHEGGDRYSYAELSQLALQGAAYPETFDPAEERFLAPDHMTAEIHAALSQAGKPLPPDEPALLFCIFHSLANCYAQAVKALGKITGLSISTLHIVGGGCQNQTLNQLTAKAAGIPVLAGPVEGTAMGNLLAQWIATGEIASQVQARQLMQSGASPEIYLP